MQRLKSSASLITLITTILLLAAPVDAQQKRPATPKKPPATEPAEPAPTFDSLLGDDSYRVYSEIRNVGQLVRSPSVNDLLDPLMKLASPPKEFKAVIKWINAHAEPLASSRMFVASWPTRPNLPFLLIAVEFSSADEARKFESELRRFMPTLMAKPTPSPGASPGSEGPKAAQPNSTSDDSAAVLPTYQIKQSGSLVLLTDKPLSFRDLKPRGSSLLAESPNFTLARNRFASESLFLYVDLKSIEKEQREQRQKWEQEEQKRRESEAANPPKEDLPDAGMEAQMTSDPALTEPPAEVVTETRQATLQAIPADPQTSGTATLSARPVQGPDPMEAAMFPIYAALFGGQTKWPEAVGIAIAFDDDGYVVRALIANAPESKSTAIPFVPQFVSGPALTPASPNVLPADTNLFVAMSVDYPLVYEGMVKTLASAEELSRRYNRLPASNAPPTSPFAAYEKKLGLSVKEDLLPLLGNEIALALPKQASSPGLSNASAEEMTTPGVGQKSPAARGLTPIIAISVKDKEEVKRLIPKIIESLAFKGANLLAQTEKRDETEITSYANVLSYAFIGDFLILSPDPAVTRQVVDSYLNHRTLSSDGHFRNSTRWQPRQLLGQVYIAPSLIDLYFPLGGGGSAQANDKMREVLSRMNPVIEPLSYALSNEGLGPLHEVHIPKSLLMVMIAGMTSKASEMPLVTNESVAKSILRTVVSAEAIFHSSKGDGRYGTLDELISEGLLSKDLIEKYGYKIDLAILANKFEATAVPLEYGKTGRLSFFVDESGVLRGGDHGGGAATLSDKPVEQ